MVRIELQVELTYGIDDPGGDFVLNIQPAHTPCQTISNERLQLSQPITAQSFTDPLTRNRYLRLHALPGDLRVTYEATVDLQHHFAPPAELEEVPVSRMPPDVFAYIYPSRYCQSDRLMRFAMSEFGMLRQGYSRVQAIQDWVRSHVTFTSNTSDSSTSAIDTLVQRNGVCRDFAHLMIALCRAVNIPARFTTGTDYGASSRLGPPDFHAYVEAYVGDRWYIFDPSATAIPMGFVRMGTGRDAADVAFATIFGNVRTQAPVIRAIAGEDASQGIVLPSLRDDALSTDIGADTHWTG